MNRYDSYKDSEQQWPATIPVNWNMLAGKRFFSRKNVVVGKNHKFYDLLSLTLNGVIKRDMDNPTGKFPTSFDTYQEVHQGDFIFCLFDNEETPRTVGLSNYDGMITGAYDIFRCISPKINSRFLLYYYLNIDEAKRMKPLYKGLRKIIPLESFLRYKIAIPSTLEQDTIVKFLDKTTTEIDKAIAQQQRMIDLLNERKQIIIQQAVTKGLNPNVKMKDSGIEWIGQVPEHWRVTKLKRKCIIVLGKMLSNNIGLVFKYICAKDVHFGSVNISDLKEMHFTPQERLIYEVKYGDILVVEGGAGAGGCAVYEHDVSDIYIQNSIMIVRGDNDMNNKYICNFLQAISQKGYIEFICNKATIPHFTKEKLGGVYLPIPPIEEQKSIVAYINKSIDPIDTEIQRHKQLITMLQERKQIIINDVVTGKIKVI